MIKVRSFYCMTIAELERTIESFISRHEINRTQIISINLSSDTYHHYALLTYEE